MTHDFETIGSGSGSGNGDMDVHLYPYSSNQRSDCESGGIAAEAVINAGNQLADYGAISSFTVYRFEAEDIAYPESQMKPIDDYSTSTDLKDDFRNFVENYHADPPRTGVHQLIHGGDSGCTDTGSDSPIGSGAEQHGFYTSAFKTDWMAWSPVCTADGLTKNAAIQEPVHCFIEEDVWSDKASDEHALGTINAYYNGSDFDYLVTPLLTYHWDESFSDVSDCYYDTTAEGHEQGLTDCTKQAVQDTANL